MQTVTLARNAMNTRFELVLHGDHPVSLRAAGEEALAEIERIENLLSLFRTGSEIACINSRAARKPVRVSPEVFSLLARAQQLGAETGGAFDITMAPLLRCWGLLGCNEGRLPTPYELAAARSVCGVTLVELDRANWTVRFAREGVMLDLGAIGKGYAVEQAAECLREAGVGSALIHGGTSTVFALGTPPEAETWKVVVDAPDNTQPLTRPAGHSFRPPPFGVPAAADPAGVAGHPRDRLKPGLQTGEFQREGQSTTPSPPLAIIPLRDESLSVSAVAGKCFVAEGRTLGHIIDPRTGEPASNALLAAVVLPSATETDALSTALLVAGAPGHECLATLRPGMRTLLIAAEAGQPRCLTHGIELEKPPAV